MKIAYTVIFNDTDDLKEPLEITEGWQYVCFTDNPNLTSKHWEIRVVPPSEPKKQSRFYKIKNHFPEVELSLYIDATFQIKRNLNLFTLNKNDGIWLNEHPMRQCAYEEARVVIDKGLDDPVVVNSQIEKCQAEGFPEQWGLWRCGIMIRNPANPLITKLCDVWYDEIKNGSWRDQASFAYSAWKTGVTPNTIPHGLTQAYFRQSLHKSNPTTEWKFVSKSSETDLTAYNKYKPIIEYYQGAHLILLKDGVLFPRWISNYVSMKNGIGRFVELVKILNGVIVYA